MQGPDRRFGDLHLAVVYLVLPLFRGHGEPGVILPVCIGPVHSVLALASQFVVQYFTGLDRPTAPLILAVEHTLSPVLERPRRAVPADGQPTDETMTPLGTSRPESLVPHERAYSRDVDVHIASPRTARQHCRPAPVPLTALEDEQWHNAYTDS